MPWYKTGTVSVTLNSNAVTGTGTAFLANSRVGDAFRGPDGGWYEVINIASDTAMSISPNYQGATAATGSYALAPMQGYVKDSADALRALVNQFGGVLAVLGTNPTQAGVRSALGLTDTDGIPEGAVNKYFSSAKVLATPLAGLDTSSNTVIVATDTVLTAAGKLQAQATSTSAVALAALPKAGGTLTGPVNDAPIQTLASAATVNIGTATSNVVAISGTTTITSFGTIAAGARRTVRFLAALVLTHNATSLILPTGTNIATAANDTAEFLSLGGGNWLCLRYNLASGKQPAFAYDRSSVVGTVSQSAGVPTGALMEYVTNGNGEAWKYVNGLLVCSRYFSTATAFSLAPGASASSGSYGLPVTAAGTGVRYYTGYATDASANVVGSTWIDVSFGALSWKFQVTNLSSSITVTQLLSIQMLYVGRWF